MRSDQSVSEMAEEVLARQASALVDRTGLAYESALEAVTITEAGRQLRELADGEHRDERALDWQASMAHKRAEEHHYSWVEGYMEWLQNKEARSDYYALLEMELNRLKA